MAVPKLRFKDSGGREFPEWEDKKLGEFFSKINKKNNDNLITNVITNSAVNGLIEQRMFFDKDIANKENTDKYYIIEKGDFVYNPRKSNDAPYGPVHMYESDCKGIVSPLYLCFKPINKTLSLLFMKNYFKSSSWHKYIYANGDTGARDDRVSVKVTTFLDMPVNIPSLPEQQKIADFLTAYDTMIDTQSQRVEAMKTRKKGLLQKIFSQEIRFKNDNGQNYPEWEKKTVGSLANNIVGGGTPSTKNPAFYAGEIPWISSSDLVEDKINYLNMTRFITQDAINRSATKLIPAQSVMIVCRVGVGKVAVNELPLCTSQDFMNLIVKEENSPVFIGYLLMNLMVKRKNSVQGTAIKGIPSAEIKKFKVLVPALPEQQKIADFLTTVDAQIDVEEKRLETMKTIKKGLLQQMFI